MSTIRNLIDVIKILLGIGCGLAVLGLGTIAAFFVVSMPILAIIFLIKLIFGL